MRGVNITRTVSLTLTAEDWQLYTSKPKIKSVAKSINRAVASAIKMHPSKSEARHFARKFLNEYAEFGAADTEPYGVLEDILDAIYGGSRD